MRQVAFQLNMEYMPKEEWGLIRQLRDFRLFRRGGRKRIRHLLHQQEPLMQYDLRIFDYQYTVSTGKSSRRYEQTVFFLQSQSLALPECFMRPETFFHRIGEFLGFEDIDFADFPDFSNQYRLTGEDQAYIEDRFTPGVRYFFTIEKGWTLETVGYYLVLYQKNKILHPRAVKYLHQKGLELYRLFQAGSAET